MIQLQIQFIILNMLENLCEMTGRFSDDEELRIPNMYCSQTEIRDKVNIIV